MIISDIKNIIPEIIRYKRNKILNNSFEYIIKITTIRFIKLKITEQFLIVKRLTEAYLPCN